MTHSKKKNAFTLIELLVVISIIALLLSILMPSLQRVKEQALKVTCGSNLRQLALAVNTYGASNDDIVPLSCPGGTNAWYVANAAGGPPAATVYYNLFDALGPYVGKKDKGVWDCPSAIRWRKLNEHGYGIDNALNLLPGWTICNYQYFSGATFYNLFGPSSPPWLTAPWTPTPNRLAKMNSRMVLIQDEARNRDLSPILGIIVTHNRKSVAASSSVAAERVVYTKEEVDGANLGFADGSVRWHNGNELRYIGYDQGGGWGGNTLSVKP